MGDKIAFAGPWIGEFGWEIMTWVPYLRKLSHDYDKMYISTFPGVEALYSGFHCEIEFMPRGHDCRLDEWESRELWHDILMEASAGNVTNENWEAYQTNHITPIKKYHIDGEYARYGSPVVKDVAVLFHARGIEKRAFKNWSREKWTRLAKEFPGAGSIGSLDDLMVSGGDVAHRDCRGEKLQNQMDLIASASIVIGQSSGIMHLALMCGTPIATWGDCNNFGESLEKRYKETWNPFHTPVTWIGDTWDPDPEDIMAALKPKNVPAPQVLSILHDAVESGQYIISTAWMGERDGKEAVFTGCSAMSFPDDRLDQAAEQMTKDVNGAISKAKAERIPVSWR
jgi:hypothetical protein